ncbi:hypothetical protein PoB_005202300 [Plakobranchus ocellatus]|uniref:Uncharacterized protein n=1 Tax=Plakobranchus ocellatus TaxID=259542 RepID=A0AAV4C270_9GAST|nr:hypothetical protein PoB_005202300 [Plakobranchus ocellatus]
MGATCYVDRQLMMIAAQTNSKATIFIAKSSDHTGMPRPFIVRQLMIIAVWPYSIATVCCAQQGDLRLSGLPSDQGTGGGARTRNRRIPADLRADSLVIEPPKPPKLVTSQKAFAI